RHRRLLATAAGAAVVVTIAAGCGSSSKTNNSAPTTATAASGTGATPTTAGSSGTPTGATIKLAYLGDQSGTLASTFGGGVIGAQTFVSYYNAHGGLYGHKLRLKVYDDQSSPSAVLSNARLAVQDGAQAIISNDVYFDTAANYLKQQGIPVF